MNKNFCSFVGIVSCLLILTGSLLWIRNTSAQTLKVITFNTALLCIGGPDCTLVKEERLEERAILIGNWIKRVNPDIIFLQEVFRTQDFETVRKTSGMSYAVTPNIETGQAILSKFPITEPKFEPFFWQGSTVYDCKRLFHKAYIGLFSAQVQLPNTRKIRVASTHQLARFADYEGFDQPSDFVTPQRKITILQMKKRIDEFLNAGHPVIFSGDFNMNQFSTEYPFFNQVMGLQDAFKEHTAVTGQDWYSFCTFCADNPMVKASKAADERILDYVWSNSRDFSIDNAMILSETDEFSDHRAVVAVLRFRANTKPISTKELDQNSVVDLIDYLGKVQFHNACEQTTSNAKTQTDETLTFLKTLLK